MDFEESKGEELAKGKIIALPYKWGAGINLYEGRIISISRMGADGNKFFIKDEGEGRIIPIKVKC